MGWGHCMQYSVCMLQGSADSIRMQGPAACRLHTHAQPSSMQTPYACMLQGSACIWSLHEGFIERPACSIEGTA